MDNLIFISHSSVNTDIAHELYHAFNNVGVGAWIAPECIPPGARYPSAIQQAIRECKAMVLVYSEYCNISENVATEIEKAFNAGKYIIPFCIDNSQMNDDLDYYLCRKQKIMAVTNYKQHIPSLINTIIRECKIEGISYVANTMSNDDENYELAVLYDNADENEKALPIFMQLANEGHPKAQNELGSYYELGLGGLSVNIPKAIEWYQKSAEQGYAEAMDSLGSLYCECDDPAYINGKLGVEWYQKAINAGYSSSNVGLAYCYENGIYFKQDFQKAYDLYNLALESAEGDDKGFILFEIAMLFDKVEQYSDALNYFKQVLDEEYNEPHVLWQIGCYYYRGLGCDVDYSVAFKYFRQSYDLGYVNAGTWMADCYLEGRGVEEDFEHAIELYKEAASKGDSWAYSSLGRIYGGCESIHFNEEKAIYYYEEGAKLGNDDCMSDLGDLYKWDVNTGELSTRDRLEKAVYWYSKAAELGNEYCQKQISDYEKGDWH